jgi:hypothetical protein
MIILAAGLCILLCSTLLQGALYMQTDGNGQAGSSTKAANENANARRGWNQMPIGQKSVHGNIQKMVASLGNKARGGMSAASADAVRTPPDSGNTGSSGSEIEEQRQKKKPNWSGAKRREKLGNSKLDEKRAKQARQKELAGANLEALASSGLTDKLGHKRWFSRLAKRNGGDVKQLINDLSPANGDAAPAASVGAPVSDQERDLMGGSSPKSELATEDKDGSDDEASEDDYVDDQQLDDADFDDDVDPTSADDTFEEETR